MSVRLSLVISILCFTAGVSAAQPDRFVTTVGVAYASLYVTDGFRVGNAASVMQMSLKLDIPRTDFSLMYWNALRTSRSDKEYDEHDFLILYSRDFFKDSRYAFNFHGFYDYWNFPNTRALRDGFGDVVTTGKFQGSKLNAGFSMPNLFRFESSRLVPAYNAYYWIYWADQRSDQYKGGARHELSLTYTKFFAENASGFGSPYAGVFSSLSYNDGAFGVRPGMSHTLASAFVGTWWSSGLDISVSANQQFSHQPTVNRRNDFWVTASVSRAF